MVRAWLILIVVTHQAVCVEAGMLALRRDAVEVNHEDMNEGIIAVQVILAA